MTCRGAVSRFLHYIFITYYRLLLVHPVSLLCDKFSVYVTLNLLVGDNNDEVLGIFE